MSEKNKTVMVSGGFDPVHAGHIRMIREAANENGEEFLPTIDPMAYGSKT